MAAAYAHARPQIKAENGDAGSASASAAGGAAAGGGAGAAACDEATTLYRLVGDVTLLFSHENAGTVATLPPPPPPPPVLTGHVSSLPPY